MKKSQSHSVILFDLDGTLTDPAVGITRCISHALSQLNRPIPSTKELCSFIGPPLQATFRELLGEGEKALVDQAIDLYRERFAAIGIYENEIYPGILEALETLQKKECALYVATSKPAVYAVEIIRHFGLSSYFQRIYGSELSGIRTKKGELIAHLLAEESIPSDRAIMVGDRRHDIEGAKENRLRATVGVTYGYGSVDELQRAGADNLCYNPETLVSVLSAVR